MGRLRARVVRGPHRDDSARWYWRVERHVDGRDVTVDTGWWRRDDLIDHLATLPQDAGPRRVLASDCTTIGDLMSYWLGHIEDREAAGDIRAGTARRYRMSAQAIVRQIGDLRISRVTPLTPAELRTARRREGMSQWTVHHEGRALYQAWAWGHEVGLHDRPLLVAPRASQPKAEGNRYTPSADEVAAVIAELDGWPRDVLQLLFATGARIGEVATIRARDYDAATRTLRLDGKTGLRDVYLRPRTAALLDGLVDGVPADRRIWPVNPGTILRKMGITYLRRACAAAGVPVFTPHGLRRAAVDRMLRSGVDVATASRVTGHSVGTMLRHYRQVTPDDLREAARRASLEALDVPETGRVLRFPASATPHNPASQVAEMEPPTDPGE
jgi:integrase